MPAQGLPDDFVLSARKMEIDAGSLDIYRLGKAAHGYPRITLLDGEVQEGCKDLPATVGHGSQVKLGEMGTHLITGTPDTRWKGHRLVL